MKKFFILLVLFIFGSFVVSAARTTPLLINHTSVDISDVPSYWIEKAKTDYNVTYGHTSHGSQIVTGISMIQSSLYNYSTSYPGTATSGVLSFWDGRMSGASDLGNPNRTAWATATRNHLNGVGANRNLVMWSWCGQAGTATETDINTYLSLMADLEEDFPNVTFVYMTGHLDGRGPEGNLYLRNNQIRDYCLANNKVLFDFADIESFDPDGTYYPYETDACSWCTTWCSTHNCSSCSSCAHSHCFNCYNKGKAFWYMMAKLAEWDETGTTTTTTTSSTSTTYQPCNIVGDYPTCGEITLQEVIDGITSWSNGTTSLSDVVNLISYWANQ